MISLMQDNFSSSDLHRYSGFEPTSVNTAHLLRGTRPLATELLRSNSMKLSAEASSRHHLRHLLNYHITSLYNLEHWEPGSSISYTGFVSNFFLCFFCEF